MKNILLFLLFMTAASINAQTVMWTDDPEHTRIGFEVKHAGLSFVSGYFSDFDITVRQKNGDCTNTDIRVEVRTASVSTGVEARNKHLRSSDFFDVERFPMMVFKSTEMKMLGTDKGEIYGELTLHGITKKVRFDVMLIGRKESPVSGKETAGFRLQGVIRCSDFQLGSKYIPTMISSTVNSHQGRVNWIYSQKQTASVSEIFGDTNLIIYSGENPLRDNYILQTILAWIEKQLILK